MIPADILSEHSEIPLHGEDMSMNIMSNAVAAAYTRGEEDETIKPLVRYTGTNPVGCIKDGDYVIFYDIRGEREIELSQALSAPSFDMFERNAMKIHYTTMIEYAPEIHATVAYPPDGPMVNTLGEVLSKNGIRQLRVSESEKAVHASFFLNGKRQDPFKGEDRYFIESDRTVAEFDEKPEMDAVRLSDFVIAKTKAQEYGFTFVNFPNVDVVGHTENTDAIMQAVRVVDRETARIVNAVAADDLTIIITADHGTVEEYLYNDGTKNTGHTANPVPFICIPPHGVQVSDDILYTGGALTDIAPTILHLLGQDIPSEMTGTTLIKDISPFKKTKRVLLLLLDGWGERDDSYGNIIIQSGAPHIQQLKKIYPAVRLASSGIAVGLPEGAVGNSESGHLHIGAGRIVSSDKLRINRDLENGRFYTNKAFCAACEGAVRDNTALHLLGIVSFFSSHGELKHLYALLELAKKYAVPNVYIHSLLGRRGEHKDSGVHYIGEVEKKCEQLGIGNVVTVMGRYWALDRENNWDRIERAYRSMVFGDGEKIVENQ